MTSVCDTGMADPLGPAARLPRLWCLLRSAGVFCPLTTQFNF